MELDSYIVVSPTGAVVMYSTACRYSRETEKSLMDAGYRIYINGKELRRDGRCQGKSSAGSATV